MLRDHRHAETLRQTTRHREWKRLNCKRHIVKRGYPINLYLQVNRVVGSRHLMLIEAVSSPANRFVLPLKTNLRRVLKLLEFSDSRCVTFERLQRVYNALYTIIHTMQSQLYIHIFICFYISTNRNSSKIITMYRLVNKKKNEYKTNGLLKCVCVQFKISLICIID